MPRRLLLHPISFLLLRSEPRSWVLTVIQYGLPVKAVQVKTLMAPDYWDRDIHIALTSLPVPKGNIQSLLCILASTP